MLLGRLRKACIELDEDDSAAAAAAHPSLQHHKSVCTHQRNLLSLKHAQATTQARRHIQQMQHVFMHSVCPYVDEFIVYTTHSKNQVCPTSLSNTGQHAYSA